MHVLPRCTWLASNVPRCFLGKCGGDGGSQPGREEEGSDVSEFGGVVTSVPFGTSAPDLQ